jgi:AbrB family looped-hinge helix DNA binding protein
MPYFRDMADRKVNFVRVGAQGRIVIPAEIRRELGIEPGDELIPRVEDGRLVLGNRKAALERLQALFADVPPDVSLADQVIANRREEFRLEEEKRKRLGWD